MVFINGQFPGPLLEVEQGEWVEVVVVNHMPFNTSIHYHGIEQIGTPWADGVPGFTQRAIVPGQSFTYKWKADQYGSYFYHAHEKGQIEDGCYGPLVIHPKKGIAKPFDKIARADVKLLEEAERDAKPIILTDWRHTTFEKTWALQLASGIESSICVDSILLNGKGAVNCWSREDITKYTSPAVAPMLQQMNATITAKGCVPPIAIAASIPNSKPNLSALPAEVFDICTPTKGSKEVIKAPRNKKWLALDIISTAGVDTFSFSIDEHSLWVYQVDGHYIVPQKVDVLTVVNGDRYSVFVELTKKRGNYGIQIASQTLSQLIDTTAIFSYEGYGWLHEDLYTYRSRPFTTRAGSPTSKSVTIFNPAMAVSFPPQFPQPAPKVDQTFFLSLVPGSTSYLWGLNGTLFNSAIDTFSTPLLYQNPATVNPGSNITMKTLNNTWVDLVFIVATPGQPPHPIHKHSNKGFILGQGDGPFNWTSVAAAAEAVPKNFNLVTPPYRDSFLTPPTQTGPAWLAVRYHVINPGPFMIHCHVQSHMSGGMAMVIMDGVDEWPETPANFKN
ncbi:multicopper oxidase [Amniculicola lignicola CBS 123094]|uniref:Multicopper oxidase n=1 Tax=Amniculicola lignicola CBS 123094 TaxID=1392246 RepID=A0A6A5WTZ7_9PLEO|nr:multicopper oxidase [Amniculicola lignicola CBS 123094]